MLLVAALSGLLAIGVWLYCLADILLTPRQGCRMLPKRAWLAIAGLTFLAGAGAWVAFGRPVRLVQQRPRRRSGRRPLAISDGSADRDPRAALARSRHPAGRARPVGPDDDPEFLHQLDQMIRGGYDAGNDV
jgi:hypothetical protein